MWSRFGILIAPTPSWIVMTVGYYQKLICILLKGELKLEISFLHVKVLTLIKAKSNVFLWYVQCCTGTRRSKTKILTTRALPPWIEFDVVTSHRQTRHLEYGLWLLISMFLRCDVTTSNSIQDGGALVVNILVFDLRVQLQHCTYQRKTLLLVLIN